jgi:hypothetical protein
MGAQAAFGILLTGIRFGAPRVLSAERVRVNSD